MYHTPNRLLARVSDPASEPVTLSEAKAYLRIDNANDDALIGDLIAAARSSAENWLRRSLITQSWKIAYDGLGWFNFAIAQREYASSNEYDNHILLPMGPVNSITSVIAFNQDGSSQTLSANTYFLNAARTMCVLTTLVSAFRMEITYATGYGSASAVPKPIKQGMLSHIAALYDNRGQDGAAALPEQALALYMPFREVKL